MDELTISYGLLAPQARASQDLHILPITKILYPEGQDGYFLTCSRDGSVIKHRFDGSGATIRRNRMQAHSDWVTDIIQVSRNKFITVSHDFSIVLLTLHDGSDTWETKIIGDHEDYIKCVVHVPSDDGDFLFATGGLDKKTKVWRLENDEATLIHDFPNVTKSDDTGSIYAMVAMLPSSERNFDLVVGDCNGDLIFYSVKSRREVQRISRAHETNIKVVKTVNNATRLLSSCSDGLIRVWNLTVGAEEVKNIACCKLKGSIWGIYGTSLGMLYVADSNGNINKIDLLDADKPIVSPIYCSENSLGNSIQDVRVRHGGILDLMSLSDDVIVFSKSTDSNLYRLNTRTGELATSKGGFALTKSSLLTNRRHVITENTKGEIQRWDIVLCELLDTFDVSEGDFDEVVAKYTSKEILSHWCSVAVKVGMLFIKLNPRILNTEVYGTALKDYKVLNDVDVNTDERYNLGKIVVNSLFNEFVSYEMQKDKAFRKQLTARRGDTSKEATASPQDLCLNFGETKIKDKRRKSAFYRFSSTTPNLDASTTSMSAPNTPFHASDAPALPKDEQPLLPPSAMSAGEKSTADGAEFTNTIPVKGSEGRTLSSGSLISRKLKLLRSHSRTGTGTSTPVEPHAIVSSDVEDSTAEEENHGEPVEWNQAFNGDNLAPQQMADLLYAKLKPIASTDEAPGSANSEKKSTSAPNSMADFIKALREGYKQTYNANSSSLKLLTRRLPETKIVRDPSSPIIRIKSGVLLVVHSWSKTSCGGRVLFTTYLPASRNLEDDSDSILQESEEDGDSNEDDEKLHKFDLVDNEYGNAMNRRETFEQLEKNLPFWFAKCLFCDNVTGKKQPKLNFIIEPWQDHDLPATAPAQPPQQHHRLKFGRLKSSETIPRSTELPKISEANVKLIAPGMIKVKKIKVYIVDRFETKSPEMKAKIEPSEWMELLCKGQVLDNDMTLSTVRTLYWKSQGEIVFQYRRKMTSSSSATSENSNPTSKDL